jgi:hypothetical protein
MGGDEWDPQRQQALRMDGIIVVVVIIIVVVVVEKGKAIKEIKIVSNSSVRESRSRSGPCQRS